MKSVVVQFSGRQGSGKTSTAEAVNLKLQKLNIMVAHHSYAAVLYEMHGAVLKIMSQFEKVPAKDGRLLQVLGTEWGRHIYGENVWVNVVKKNMAQVEILFKTAQELALAAQRPGAQGLVHLISDCRFPNEASAFPELVYRMECPEEVRKTRILATPGQNWRETVHESETALDDYTSFTEKFDSSVLSVEQISTTVVDQVLAFMEAK